MDNKINTLSEFVDAVGGLARNTSGGFAQNPYGNLVFRGQGGSEWALAPKLARPPFTYLDVDEPAELLEREFALLRAFKVRGIAWARQRPESLLEWMALGQHYGLPTRLLDWTTNPLVALFFAVGTVNVSGDREPGDAAVWYHRPTRIDSLGGFQRRVVDWGTNMSRHVSYSVYDIESVLGPAPDDEMLDLWWIFYDSTTDAHGMGNLDQGVIYDFFRPPHFDARIAAQEGLFSFTGNPYKPLNEGPGNFEKLIIAASARRVIRKELAQSAGISEATLFPGLGGTARSLEEAVVFDQVR